MACYSKKYASPPKCCTNNKCIERVCIDTKRVFDVCIQRFSQADTLTVDFDISVSNPTDIQVSNQGTGEIVDLVITPIENSRLSRVKYTLEVPILVEATNTGGSIATGTTTTSFDVDIVMEVPESGVFAPTVEASAVIAGAQNSIDGNTLTTTLCVTNITKVVADVILVVPTYGYPILPPCQKYEEDVCSGMFSNTVFPE